MRIGIATPSIVDADILRLAIALRDGHQVAWVAGTAAAVVEQCAAATVDLVVMDLAMAIADAGQVTGHVVTDSRSAVLVVADSVAGPCAGSVFAAMGYGALDAADMPSSDPARLAETAASLLAKIDMVARLRGSLAPAARPGGKPLRAAADAPMLVGIGASAGGPAAVAAILAGIPRDFPGAIVVVQHVAEEFVSGMAGWLHDRSGHDVAVAREGDRLEPGRVLLAGVEGHLMLTALGRLAYTQEPREAAYRPSVDVFFESVSRHWSGAAVGVLLTGMGRDGARGLKALRDRRHHTIAQDAASSAVYGMPKAAAALHAAVDILPLNRIAVKIIEVAGRGASRLAG